MNTINTEIVNVQANEVSVIIVINTGVNISLINSIKLNRIQEFNEEMIPILPIINIH